jgi:hypothetical protein
VVTVTQLLIQTLDIYARIHNELVLAGIDEEDNLGIEYQR